MHLSPQQYGWPGAQPGHPQAVGGMAHAAPFGHYAYTAAPPTSPGFQQPFGAAAQGGPLMGSMGAWSPKQAMYGAHGMSPGMPFDPSAYMAAAASPFQVTYAPQPNMISPMPAAPDPVEQFMLELGIHRTEQVHLGFIAEYGMENDVLPSRWSINSDPSTGLTYYSDNDAATTSWDNPLTPCLQRIVLIGRQYLQAPRLGYFDEQKQALWEEHKAELAGWQEVADEEGRTYYANNTTGATKWHDPREETQFFYELETQMLDAMHDSLPPPEEEVELPCFGGGGGGGGSPTQPQLYSNGAEVLTLSDSGSARPDSPGLSPISPNSSGSHARMRNRDQEAADLKERQERSEFKCTFEKMWEAFEYIDYVYRDEREAQFLLFTRKLKERRLRKRQKEKEEYERKFGEAWRLQQEMIDEQRREEEARKKALADAEEERREREFREQQEEERRLEAEARAQAQEARRKAEEARLKMEAEEKAREAERKRLAAEEAARKREAEQRRREEEKAAETRLKKETFLQRLKDAAEGHDLVAMNEILAEGEAAGSADELLQPVREARVAEIALRRAKAWKAREAKEKLAKDFKTAKEAQEFGGSVLSAQWKAAVREVAKPFSFDEQDALA
eukprot:TRINITY_DN17251_c0_g1_i2.p1 TRINITY_DN17251_c0_g1~~TRINITY_DN17251_c0_g1_i2.p1  ORF type:complete len:619 (+),score=226.66 TRINITY_DN17251_c0_g1_i2:168-2024(+)